MKPSLMARPAATASAKAPTVHTPAVRMRLRRASISRISTNRAAESSRPSKMKMCDPCGDVETMRMRWNSGRKLKTANTRKNSTNWRTAKIRFLTKSGSSGNVPLEGTLILEPDGPALRDETGSPARGSRRESWHRSHFRQCGKAPLRCGGLDLAVDLAPEQQHQSAEIEPRQKNNHRAQRPVDGRVAVEEVQVDTQADRGEHPADDPDCTPRGEPSPLPLLYIGRPIVDRSEE